jgi:hypothetical protein
MAIFLNSFLAGALHFLIPIIGYFLGRFHPTVDVKLLNIEKRRFLELKIQELAAKLGLIEHVQLIDIKNAFIILEG